MIEISSFDLSNLFWRRLADQYRDQLMYHWNAIIAQLHACEQRRSSMDYNTGSINLPNVVALYLLSKKLQPDVVFEIGTFIGKSTTMLAMNSKHVYTCDMSNNTQINNFMVHTFPKTSSTDALAQVKDPVDLFFFDGRVQEADIPHIQRLMTNKTVFALDDFEGVEKGVVNASILQSILKNYLLLQPPQPDVFASLNAPGRCNIAVLAPTHCVSFTNQ